MKLQSYRRINKNDYNQQDQSLINTLSNSLNPAFDDIMNAFNNNVNLKDNISCTVATVQLAVDTSGSPTVDANFKLSNSKARIIGCQVISVNNNTNSTIYPTGCPFISFSQNNDVININNITGLITGNNYTINIIAWYG